MTKTSKTKNITIVVPVFCEEKGVAVFFSSLKEEIRKIPDYNWKVLFVDDGSHDDTTTVLKSLSSQDFKISIICFTRNFGKEAALTAGVREVKDSDAIICMDADMQHPPELISDFIKLWENGAKHVITIRKGVDGHSLFRKRMSSLYYFLVKKIGSDFIIEKSTDYRLIDQQIAQLFSELPNKVQSFRNNLDWLGFESEKVYFEAPKRFEGDARYSISALINLAIYSITSFSLFPLKIIGILGLFVSSFAGFLSIFCALTNLLKEEWFFTPLALFMVLNTFLIGLIMLCLGLLALYIGNINEGVLRRPDYIIREHF